MFIRLIRSYSIYQSAKDTLYKANLKLGKIAAKDIEIAEKTVPKIQDAANYLNKKTGEKLAQGIDLAQHYKAKNDAIHKVERNIKGYKNLQEKGKSIESEQCRPDDGF
ncbi:unnamed protein product [Candida verbasci]|uniref:Uncharacterized protein n=1 Tax=Candida verbasci TaxID=1227364 RepID=A0A9W4TR70_9ASCO|nr:unnamed protein product [Candida verbasci]